MSSLRIYRTGTHYGIKKYLKSLRFWENKIWTSHTCLIMRFIFQEERLLCTLELDKRAFLEVEKSHFPRPQASKGNFVLMWKLPKDSTSASLGPVWAHNSIFQPTMESCPSLRSPSTMYLGREGDLKFTYKNPSRYEKSVITRYAGQSCPSNTSSVWPKAEAKEESIVGHPTSYSTTTERESGRLHQMQSLEGNILASRPRATA